MFLPRHGYWSGPVGLAAIIGESFPFSYCVVLDQRPAQGRIIAGVEWCIAFTSAEGHNTICQVALVPAGAGMQYVFFPAAPACLYDFYDGSGFRPFG